MCKLPQWELFIMMEHVLVTSGGIPYYDGACVSYLNGNSLLRCMEHVQVTSMGIITMEHV